MKKLLSVLAVIAAAILVWFLWTTDKPPVAPNIVPPPVVTPTPPVQPTPDPRIALLTQFFQHYKCAQVSFDEINDYLHDADQNSLDYRILPAISVQESTCGNHYPPATNNLWGWNSARTGFASVPEGLEFVSEQLAGGHFYKGKTTNQQLRAYNPNPAYAGEVEQLMKEISNE